MFLLWVFFTLSIWYQLSQMDTILVRQMIHIFGLTKMSCMFYFSPLYIFFILGPNQIYCILLTLCTEWIPEVMKWKFKQWRSTIPLISTKRTITSHFDPLNTKKDNDIWSWTSRSWRDRHKNVAVLNRLMGSQTT
jgi:hypothetical protein